LNRYYYINEAISKKDCDEFIDKYKEAEFTQGKIYKSEIPELKHRNNKIHWITEANNLLVRALWSYILEFNSHHFNLILNGYETVQLARYDKNCFYGWHQDTTRNEKEGNKPTRKLTVMIQLSKPEDYEGGKFQLFNGMRELEEPPIQNQGSLVIFDSTEWHRATEITEGVRYSLTMWANGPKLV
jgi:PKHD-type hydroxylase